MKRRYALEKVKALHEEHLPRYASAVTPLIRGSPRISERGKSLFNPKDIA